MGQQFGRAPSQSGCRRGATWRRRHSPVVGGQRCHRDPAEPPALFARRARRSHHPEEPPRRERLGRSAGGGGVVVRGYVPDAGDLVWLTFDPRAGHEQRGRRPALILSPRAYNAKARLAFAWPTTSPMKGYPFEVALPPGGKIAGAILADHVKNVDWQARHIVFEAKAPAEIVTDVRERLR